MTVRLHSLPADFMTKKKRTFQLTPRREKKIKIAEEEIGLEPERVHAHPFKSFWGSAFLSSRSVDQRLASKNQSI